MNTPTDKNSNSHIEDLSAFMDGEMAADSSVFFLARMGHESELEQKWSRYHLIRDLICKQDSLVADSSFCDCVRQKYGAAEPAELPEQQSQRWLKPVIGLAMTAAVAFVAVTSVVQLPGNPVSPVLEPSALAVNSSAADKNFVTPEIPLITAAAATAVPVSMAAGSSNTAIYPIVNQTEKSANLAEYLFRQQASRENGRSVFILQKPGQRAAIILIAPKGRHQAHPQTP